jgi:hypothetical protein
MANTTKPAGQTPDPEDAAPADESEAVASATPAAGTNVGEPDEPETPAAAGSGDEAPPEDEASDEDTDDEDAGAEPDQPHEPEEPAAAGPAIQAAAVGAAASAVAAAPSGPPPPDLEALADRFGMADGLADSLRDGFRENKRAPGETKRISTLLNGLSRKGESESRRAAGEISRLVEQIQRRSETKS